MFFFTKHPIYLAYFDLHSMLLSGAAKGSAGKFNDPSKDIYDDTKRKPHLSNGAPFLLSTLSNGHGPPRVNGHPNGNLHVNVNPLDNIGQTQFMNESTSRGVSLEGIFIKTNANLSLTRLSLEWHST